MLYTKKALQMGAIAVGLAAFAGQSSLAESAKKEDSKPSVRTETCLLYTSDAADD